MSRKDLLWLTLPPLAVLLVGVGVGAAVGWGHALAAGLAVALTAPAGVFAFWLTTKFAATHPISGLLGLMVGVVVRTVVAVGGGVLAYLTVPVLAELGIGFWVWLLVAYLIARSIF